MVNRGVGLCAGLIAAIAATAGVGAADALQWQQVPSPSPDRSFSSLAAVSAVSASDAWAAGQSGANALLVHWRGSRWTVTMPPSFGSAQAPVVQDIRAIASSDVWAVGWIDQYPYPRIPLALHWDGHSWQSVVTDATVRSGEFDGVAASAQNDVWAVGNEYVSTKSAYRPLFEHWDGHRWTRVQTSLSDGTPDGVTVLSASDAWAIGNNAPGQHAVLYHWDGRSWKVATIPAVRTAYGRYFRISADSPHDVWAVIDNAASTGRVTSVTLHYDGLRWRTVPTAEGVAIGYYAAQSVAAASPSDVWLVATRDTSSGGTTLTEHWDGSGWSVVKSPSPPDHAELLGVTAIPGGGAWAVGQSTPFSTRTLVLRSG